MPPDRSLTIREYVTIGVPSIERDWLWDDVLTALKVLGELDPSRLPRARSQRSAPLFERLRESELQKQSLSISGVRSPEELAARSRSVTNLYRDALKQELLFDRELLILLDQDARQSAEMLSESIERKELLERAATDSMGAAAIVEQNEAVLQRLQDLHVRQLSELVALALLPETQLDVRRDLVALLGELAPMSAPLLRPQQVENLQALIGRASAFGSNAAFRARFEDTARRIGE